MRIFSVLLLLLCGLNLQAANPSFSSFDSKSFGTNATKIYPANSVRLFGAKGDGITNDAPAIQAAINAAEASATRRSVYLPAGTYNIASTLLITNAIEFFGEGTGNMESLTGHTTVLKKTANVPVIKIEARGVTMRGFTVCGYVGAGDTTAGILIGDSNPLHDGGDANLQNIIVQKCGGDGIWVANGNCCNLDVKVFQNNGHGLRLESTVGAYDNVNANTVRVISTSNTGDGLRMVRSAVNMIDAVVQGNDGWGIYNGFPRNMMQVYDEDNMLGSVAMTADSFGSTLNGAFFSGEPLVVNPASIIFDNDNSQQHLSLMYNLKLLPGDTNANSFTLINGAINDLTNEVQLSGKFRATGLIRSQGNMISPEFHLDSDWAKIDSGGVFVSQNPFKGDNVDGVTFLSSFGTNDPVLGQMRLSIGGHTSGNSTNRYAFLEVGDSDWYRSIVLNPYGDANGGHVGINTTNVTDPLTVQGNARIRGSLVVTNGISAYGQGTSLSLFPEAGTTNASLITWKDASVGNARGSVGFGNLGTNLLLTVNNGGIDLMPTEGINATNTVSGEKIFGIAAASGYTGTGENFMLDDDHYTNYLAQVEVDAFTQVSGGKANWLVGYNSTTNFIAATPSMLTNVLGDAGILTAALSATNATQLVNLAQLESAVAGNAVLYFDTSTASAANGFTLTGTVRATNYSSTTLPAASTNAAFTASNGQYIAGFISTNTYSRLASGLAHVELYVIDNSAGTGDIAPEFYLVNSVTKVEEVEFTPSPAYQTVPTGATPTKLTFAIPFPDYNSTTNFHILVKIKLIESGTDPTIRIVTGGAFASHIAFTLPSSFFAPINSPTFVGTVSAGGFAINGIPGFTGFTTNGLGGFVTNKLYWSGGILTNVEVISF